MHLLLMIAGLAIGFAVPALAQEQNTVDPEVRQQIEALIVKFDDAYNRSDAAAIADLFTQDGVQAWAWETAGGVASGQQAIEKRYAAQLATSPGKLVRKLVWYIQSATKYVRSRRSHTLTCLASRVTV